MKRLSTMFFCFVLAAQLCFAQKFYSIESEPGENCSNEIRISWATDTTTADSWVVYSKVSDRDWRGSSSIAAQESYRCDSYNGIWSDDEKGEPFYENVIFTKCGTSLTGLKPDTEYKYYITDGTDRSSEHRFKTAGAKEWSACIISDFHSYPPLASRLDHAMNMVNTVKFYDPSVSWILSPGDVVAYGGSYSFWKRLFEENNFSRFMWARVNGNHDNWTKRTVMDKSFEMPNRFFMGTSYVPRNGYGPEAGRSYWFRYGDAMFVMMNTEAMHFEEGFIPAKEWLEKVVTEARAGKDAPRYVVVCMHYEWFVGTSGKTSQYGRWHEVFDKLGVDLAVAGNNHVYVRTHPLYGDQVTDGSKGTVYVVTSSSDNGRGRKFQDAPMLNPDKIVFRWTEGSHTVSAIHMNVNRKRIKLTLLDREGNVVDACEVPSKKR